MQMLLLRGMMVDWRAIAKKCVFQIRELKVKNYLKGHTGTLISLDDIKDHDLKKDVKQYLIDVREHLEKKMKDTGEMGKAIDSSTVGLETNQIV